MHRTSTLALFISVNRGNAASRCCARDSSPHTDVSLKVSSSKWAKASLENEAGAVYLAGMSATILTPLLSWTWAAESPNACSAIRWRTRLLNASLWVRHALRTDVHAMPIFGGIDLDE